MKEQLAQLGTDVVRILSPFIVATLTAILGFIGVRINQWIASKTKNEKMQAVVQRATSTMIDAVKEVSQTFLGAIKSPSKEDFIKARDLALSTVKSHLGIQGRVELQTVLGLESPADLEKYLGTLLESTVHDLKIYQGKPLEPYVAGILHEPKASEPAPQPQTEGAK